MEFLALHFNILLESGLDRPLSHDLFFKLYPMKFWELRQTGYDQRTV